MASQMLNIQNNCAINLRNLSPVKARAGFSIMFSMVQAGNWFSQATKLLYLFLIGKLSSSWSNQIDFMILTGFPFQFTWCALRDLCETLQLNGLPCSKHVDAQWPGGLRDRPQMEQSRCEYWPGTLCCVLGRGTKLSQDLLNSVHPPCQITSNEKHWHRRNSNLDNLLIMTEVSFWPTQCW